MFGTVSRDLHTQREEAGRLRSDLQQANKKVAEANDSATTKLQSFVEEERRTANQERADLLSQIKTLLDESGERQAARFVRKADELKSDISTSQRCLRDAATTYGNGMDRWNEQEKDIVDKVMRSEESLRKKMEEDWSVSINCSFNITTTKANR